MPFLYDSLAAKGLVFVCDLYDQCNQLIAFEVLQRCYGMSWWQYVTVTVAIPRALKKLCNDSTAHLLINDSLYEKVSKVPKCIKYVYNCLVETEIQPSVIPQIYCNDEPACRVRAVYAIFLGYT